MVFENDIFEMISIPKRVITELIGEDTSLRVYVYGLMHKEADVKTIAGELEVDEGSILKAIENLKEKGFVSNSGGGLIRYILPEPETVKDDSSYPDRDYNIMIQRIFSGRELYKSDYDIFYRLSDTYGFEKKIVLLLLEYGIKLYGIRITPKQIMSIASSWKKEEINTIEQAKKKIDSVTKHYSEIKEVLSMLNIKRAPTEPEIELYEKWTDEWAFSFQAIKEAVKLTTYSRDPSLKYLDGILGNLKSVNAMSSKEIREYATNRNAMDEKIKEILRILPYSRLSVTESQRQKYAALIEQGFSDEMIILAARKVSEKRNPHFEDIQSVLTEWTRKGILNTSDVEEQENSQKIISAKAQELNRKLGIFRAVTQTDMDQYIKFKDTFGLEDEVIDYAASIAKNYAYPSRTLNTILSRWHEKGIKTVAEAEKTNTMNRKRSISDIDERNNNYSEIKKQLPDPLKEFEEE